MQPGDDLPYFPGVSGEMADRIAGHDWSATPLGDPTGWSPELRTVVGLLLVSAQPMFLAWGPDRTWLYNDAFSPILGQKHPHALGRPAMEVWAEARADLEPLFDRVFAGNPVHMEDFGLELDRGSGLREAHFSFSYNPIRGSAGAVAGLFGVCVEITEQVMANRQLTAQRAQFAQLFEQAPIFMAMLIGPDHRIELANPRYLELVGHRPVLRRTIAEALPDAVAQGYLDLLDGVFHSGKAFSASGSKYAAQATPCGPIDERFVDFVYQPIMDDAGKVVGIFVVGVDVTERKVAEDAVRAANESLEQRVAARTTDLRNIQTFYTHSSECHAILSERADGTFEYVEINPATLRLYGKTRDQAIGRTTEEVLGPDAAAQLNAYLAEALGHEGPSRYVRTQGGSTIEAIATPIPDEPGQPRRLAVTARDITERQQLEEQLRHAQKMEAIGQLTGGVAHDFNNLLQVISGSLQLLAKDVAGNERAERRLAIAETGVTRGTKLAAQLLAFGRRQPLAPKVVNLGRVVRGMDDMLRRALGDGVEIETVVSGGLWNTLVDPFQVENALLNLSINARDAMDGQGRLTIEAGNASLEDDYAAHHADITPGQYVMLAVSDNGRGMTPEVLEHVFEPFFTTKPEGQGTGLGLSMVYGFVRQSGGHVKIYSEPGEGTTIRLYLPRARQGEALAPDTGVEPIDGGTETILVVEDDDEVREVVVEMLTDLGYRVLKARDAQAGLVVVESGVRIDLLFTDVVMPGPLRSPELARRARALLPSIAVLFTSGYTANAIVHGGRLDEGTDLLSKPYTREALARKIRQLLLPR